MSDRCRLVLALAFIATSYGQVQALKITVTGGPGVTFQGLYRVCGPNGEWTENKVRSSVPTEFTAMGTAVILTFQNDVGSDLKGVEMRVDGSENREVDERSPLAQTRPFLDVAISGNGTTLKHQRSDAPHGVILLATNMPAGGLPRQAEFTVDGTAKYAFVQFTNESGDTEQQLVELPFRKSFFPRVGWVLSVTAQKVKVTRLDPLRDIIRPQIQVLADGVAGSVHVHVQDVALHTGDGETSDPFGIASAELPIR